jgi:hypothetical protein
VQLTQDAARLVWRFQFRIREALFWLVLALSATGLIIEPDEPAFVFAVPFVFSQVGILRWHRHRRNSRHGLAIA